MRKYALILLGVVCLALRAFCVDASYKQVLIFTNGGSVRVRLPLTDVTGKVRVKEWSAAGFGLPIAPTKTALGADCYLEWQIGYDTPITSSPSVIPWLQFSRNGEIKYGHELSKIIFESVKLGVLSTNDLTRELERLKTISPGEFEEDLPVQIETETNLTSDGFQRAFQRVPQFTITTAHGSVQIQLKQKQRAVGYQAMVYVCLPMKQVLDMNGRLRGPDRARSKETVFYDFNSDNTDLLLDIIQAFGLASPQHNQDMQDILGKILESAGQ